MMEIFLTSYCILFFNNTDHVFNSTYLENIFEKFELQYGKFVINDRFQFANRTGVYTWNSSTKSWNKTAASTTAVTLKFPSRENQTIDSEATLDSFGDVSTVFNTSSVWIPKTFNFVVKRSDKTVFFMNLSNVTFDAGTNFSMPLSADINIFTAPFTHKITWRRINTKEFELNYNSSTPNGCVTSLVTNVTLQHADYGNMTSIKNDIKQVKGVITEGSLKATYAVNVEALAAIAKPTIEQINSNTKAEALYDGKKIGDLIIKKVNNKDEIFIVYSDGTSENVEVYVGDFQEKIEAIFANYLK
ncbi:MAG: hypothetical protein KBA33_00345 [Cloacibacterium sp.]|nr:hypothetical protein [Cloacibacterium sp.]